ncbi:hypothetical protein MELA_02945 [Candidatus Methylomirabilis lanthanidiphila]|uniref:Uncharacterized protein n=1 Tax=Candidatus Methylomirabilis lanthanidiphila TaxID=2211376 RepID=A0A564ZMK5_9BACT|nr:hypothetical protein MELA_02945 [Candidatus Methylomirabilis lanthanidiphila]
MTPANDEVNRAWRAGRRRPEIDRAGGGEDSGEAGGGHRRAYTRDLKTVPLAGIGQGAAQRELARWVEAGLLVRTRRGNQVYY